jgi:hypothetical protein
LTEKENSGETRYFFASSVPLVSNRKFNSGISNVNWNTLKKTEMTVKTKKGVTIRLYGFT